MTDPTLSLAKELLDYVFNFCDNADVVRAAQICQHWRLSARTHRLYYVNISFKGKIHTASPSPTMYSTVIRRLRNVARFAIPLRLSLTITRHILANSMVDEDVERAHSVSWTEIADGLNAVLPLLRWFHLTSISAIFLEMLLGACDRPAPLLEEFYVIYDTPSTNDIVLSHRLFGESAPRLRELDLSGFSLPPDDSPVTAFVGAKYLSISSTEIGHRNLIRHMPAVQALNMRPGGGLSSQIDLPRALHTLLIQLPQAAFDDEDSQAEQMPLESFFRRISRPTLRRFGLPVLVPFKNFDPIPYMQGLPQELHVYGSRTSEYLPFVPQDTLRFIGHKSSEEGRDPCITREFYSRRSYDLLKPYTGLSNRFVTISIQPAILLPLLRLALEFPAVQRIVINVDMLSKVFPRRWVGLTSDDENLLEDAQFFEQELPTKSLRPEHAPLGPVARMPVLQELKLCAKPQKVIVGPSQETFQVVRVWRARVLDLVKEIGVDESVLVLDGVELADRVERVTHSVPDVFGRDWALSPVSAA